MNAHIIDMYCKVLCLSSYLLKVDINEHTPHTGLIGSRSFQNYAFKGWLSLKTMKLWLLVFNDLDYKADIGQHFLKNDKSTRLHHRHKIIKTNL